jgi:hypothetical protein
VTAALALDLARASFAYDAGIVTIPMISANAGRDRH